MPSNHPKLWPAALGGLALGAAGSALLLLLADPWGSGVQAATRNAALPTNAVDQGSTVADPLESSLNHTAQAELEQLRRELELLRSQDERRLASAATAPVSRQVPQANLAAGQEPAALVSPQLRSELDTLLNSGLLDSIFGGDPETLTSFLVSTYLSAEQPQDAWRVLQLNPLDPYTYGSVAEQLLNAGATADARLAYLEAYRGAPDEWNFLEALSKLDPHAALAILDDHLAGVGEFADPSLQVGRAKLLLASGRTQDSRALIDTLLAADPANGPWDLLRELDPQAAEQRLRELAAAGQDADGGLRTRLAQMLLEAGRNEEAQALFEELLTLNSGDLGPLYALGNLAPQRAQELALERLRTQPDNAELWGLVGQSRLTSGDLAGAVEALARAFELAPGNGQVGVQLLEHAPDQYWSIFERSVRTTMNDELWGDLADAYWQAGRALDARLAWEQARSLDPGDGEWSGKLRSLALKRDPLNPGALLTASGELEQLGY